jgi:hypothetical protein
MDKYMRWARSPLGILVIVLVISLGLIAFLDIANRHTSADTMLVNGRSFSLEVAQTEHARELGLGARASLPADHGMLFVFDHVAPECFWMKDMHFPLDIIWVSSDKKVVHIEQNVSPSTYPNSFCPVEPVKYVIELNAGMAARADIRAGESLDF